MWGYYFTEATYDLSFCALLLSGKKQPVYVKNAKNYLILRPEVAKSLFLAGSQERGIDCKIVAPKNVVLASVIDTECFLCDLGIGVYTHFDYSQTSTQ